MAFIPPLMAAGELAVPSMLAASAAALPEITATGALAAGSAIGGAYTGVKYGKKGTQYMANHLLSRGHHHKHDKAHLVPLKDSRKSM